MQLLEHCTHSTEAIVKWIFIENAHANSLRIRGVGQTSAGTGPYIHIHTLTHTYAYKLCHSHTLGNRTRTPPGANQCRVTHMSLITLPLPRMVDPKSTTWSLGARAEMLITIPQNVIMFGGCGSSSPPNPQPTTHSHSTQATITIILTKHTQILNTLRKMKSPLLLNDMLAFIDWFDAFKWIRFAQRLISFLECESIFFAQCTGVYVSLE